MKNANKPINPSINSVENGEGNLCAVFTESGKEGLTKREYFAGLFIQGILAAQSEMRCNGYQNNHFGGQVENIVREALDITDELLKQLTNEN